MSLPVLAQHMASKGRNGDSMLVHMTPGEVQGLHALAAAHGGMLTVNPDTGLVEAGFLKSILPMIAGFALGPAGFGLMSSLGAAATVGGVTALATGSLQKGLMAGLGAYGGSSLGAGLMGAGEGAIGASALASEAGKEAVASKIMEQELTQEAARSAVAKEAVAGSGFLDKLVAGGKAVLAPGGLNTLSAGMPAGSFSPKTLALMAAAPVLADQMVPTTTGMPSTKPGDTGYIRTFGYDAASLGQGPQGLQALAPVPANQINYGQPPGGANGGLVAFADGGWTGDIPAVGDPRRKEFEQYLASQMTPQAYQETRASPYSVASPDFAAGLAANLAGQRSLQDQGITSVFGKEFASYGRTPQDVRAWNQALMTERPMGGHIQGDTDLNQLLDTYMGAVKSGDARQAIRSMSRMTSLGLNPKDARAMASTLDPEFESRAYQQYEKAGKSQFGSSAFLTGIGENYFSPGSGGWNLVSRDKALFGLSDEDIAYGLGVSEKDVKNSLAGATQWELNAEGRPIAKARPVAAPAPEPEASPAPETQTPALDYLTGRTPETGTVAPPAPTSAPRAETPYPEAPAPATAPIIKTPEATVTPGTVTGGGVTTYPTKTTPTFELPRDEQVFTVPTGTITGGTVTGAVDTKEALREYEKTAPTGKPPAITTIGTLEGYEGEDKTYGGVEKPYAFPTQAQLGTAGSISRGTETMDDVRRLVGNRYDQAPSTFTPSVTGASKSAYDFLMGKGEYPTIQTLPGGAPLWKPYVQAAGATGTTDAFAPRTAAPTAQFGFKAPTTGAVGTGTQRWKNTKTGEIYNAPYGYTPPSADWVMDTQGFGSSDTDLTSSGVGVGSGNAPGPGGDGFGDGESAKAGGLMQLAMGGYAQGGYNLGSYSDGGRLLRGPGDGVSDSIPATIGRGQPARLADGEFVVPARIVSELGNGSTEAGARKLYAMMDRVQRARGKTTGKGKVAANTKADRFLPA